MALSGKALKVMALSAMVMVTVSGSSYGSSYQYYYPPTNSSPSHSSSPSGSRSARPSVSRSPRPSVSRSPRPSVSRSPKPSESRSPRPSESRSPRPSESRSPRPSESRSPRPSESRSPRPSESRSPRPSESRSPRPSESRSPRPSPSKSSSASPSRSASPSSSKSASPSPSNSAKPSVSRTPRPSKSRSPRPSPSASSTRSARPSQSQSPEPSVSSSPSQSRSAIPSFSQTPRSNPTMRSQPSTVVDDDNPKKCGCKPFCAQCSRNTDCESNICMSGRCGSTTATKIITCRAKTLPLCGSCRKNEDCASDNCVRDRCVTPLNKDRKMDPVWEEKRIRMEQVQSVACSKRRFTNRCGGCGGDKECKDQKCQFGFCAKTSKDFLLCAHQFVSTPKSEVPVLDRESLITNRNDESTDDNDELGFEFGRDGSMLNMHDEEDEVYWDDGQEGEEFDDAKLKWNNDEGDIDVDLQQKMQDTERNTLDDNAGRSDADTSSEYTVEGASCPRTDDHPVDGDARDLNVRGASYVSSEESGRVGMENSARIKKGEVGDAAWDLVRDETEVEGGERVEGDGSDDADKDEANGWRTVREASEEKEEENGDEEGYDVHGDQVDVGAEEDLVLDDADAHNDVQVRGMVSIGGPDDAEIEGGFVDEGEEDEILKKAMRDALRS